MTQLISEVSWKRHTKAVTDAGVKVSNNTMKKAALEVKKYLVSNTSYTRKYNLLEEVTEVSVSVGGSWGSRGFLLRQGLVDICSEEAKKVVIIIIIIIIIIIFIIIIIIRLRALLLVAQVYSVRADNNLLLNVAQSLAQ